MERRDLVQAEDFLAQAVRSCPENPEAHRHYGDVLWENGKQFEAVSQLEEAARLAENDAGNRVRLAEMRLALGQIEAAEHEINAALDLDPKLAQAWAVRGRIKQRQGNLSQAIADFHRALGYAPQDRQALAFLADAYRKQGEPQKALTVLHAWNDTYALGEQPPKVDYLMGLTYKELGCYDQALACLTRALGRSDPAPEWLYQLAETRMLAGSPSGALDAARHALAINPNHQASRDLFNRLEQAERSQVAPRRY